MMNAHEARLSILNRIRDVLVDLSDEDPQDLDVQEGYGEVADLLLQALDLRIVGVPHENAPDDAILASIRP